jgi:hypothetical protein
MFFCGFLLVRPSALLPRQCPTLISVTLKGKGRAFGSCRFWSSLDAALGPMRSLRCCNRGTSEEQVPENIDEVPDEKEQGG